ncbi:MAG TPA: hemolysin family protein [bacterium]|nr:hemolysin family protein [bacterium]
MEPYFATHLIFLGFLLLLAMFFAAVETSLLSLPRPLLQQRSQGAGFLGAAYKAWQDHPNRILTSILIGTNVTTIAASTLAAYTAVHLSETFHWSRAVTGTVVSASVTVILIVFGEAIPKLTGRSHSALVAQWLIIPIYLFDRILSPFTWVMAHTVSRLFPGLTQTSVALVTEEDVKHLIDMGQEAGTIQETEKTMIQSIFKFTDTKVGQVMIHRTDMFCVDIQTNVDNLVDLLVQNGYSRVPVYKGDVDHIVGIIHSRDLLSIWKHHELIVLQDLLRKPYFVPESMRVERLLREFKRGRFHMAVVVDEYGGTAGLVTLEDLVEEIFGEIKDEHEGGEEKAIAKQADGSWVIEADVALDDVNEALGVKLVPKGEVASLGGYLMEIAGRVPKKGRVLEDREAVFKILDAGETSILKVKAVKRKTPLPLTPPPEAPKPRKKKAKTPPVETSQPTVPGAETTLETTESNPDKPL